MECDVIPPCSPQVTCKQADGKTRWGWKSLVVNVLLTCLNKSWKATLQLNITFGSFRRYSSRFINLGIEWKSLACFTSWFLCIREKTLLWTGYETVKSYSLFGNCGEETNAFIPYRAPCRCHTTCRIESNLYIYTPLSCPRYNETLAKGPWKSVKRNSLLYCTSIYCLPWV